MEKDKMPLGSLLLFDVISRIPELRDEVVEIARIYRERREAQERIRKTVEERRRSGRQECEGMSPEEDCP